MKRSLNTMARHFYQISPAGNCLPLESGAQNLGAASAGFIEIHSTFFYGFLGSDSDETLKKRLLLMIKVLFVILRRLGF